MQRCPDVSFVVISCGTYAGTSSFALTCFLTSQTDQSDRLAALSPRVLGLSPEHFPRFLQVVLGCPLSTSLGLFDCPRVGLSVSLSPRTFGAERVLHCSGGGGATGHSAAVLSVSFGGRSPAVLLEDCRTAVTSSKVLSLSLSLSLSL